MNVEIKPRLGYASTEITKAPDWQGLVAWDLLFNNLATGLFLVDALGELANPSAFEPLGKAAYPIALVILLADLSCLVFDLGNPLKFHHMLRVFKPSSPMSLGTWCLTAFSLPLTVLASVDLLAAIGWLPEGSMILGGLRKICLIVGLVPALGSAVYKGVLFSTSSQPSWKDGRWLGGYLVNSALLLGCAELLAIARVMGQGGAASPLRVALVLLLVVHVVPLALLIANFREGFSRGRTRYQLVRFGSVALGLGWLIPLVLLVASSGPAISIVALGLLLIGSMAIRWKIVILPHEAH